MAYDYEGAINAGANPSDVINYLSKQTGYNSQGALQAGANPKDVLKYMSNLPPKTVASQAPTEQGGPMILTSLARPAQLGGELLGRAITNPSTQNISRNDQSLGNMATQFLQLAHKETNPQKSADLIQKAQEAIKGMNQDSDLVQSLQQQIHDAQRIHTPSGTINPIDTNLSAGKQAESIAGTALKTTSAGIPGFAGFGAMHGAGQAMEQGGGGLDVAGQSLKEAILAKLFGFGLTKIAGPAAGYGISKLPTNVQNLLMTGAGTGMDILNKIGEVLDSGPSVNLGEKAMQQGAEKFAGAVDTALSPTAYVKGLMSGAKTVGGGIKDVYQGMTTPKTEEDVNNLIDKTYAKAVKPSIAGIKSNSQLGTSQEAAQNVIKDITKNLVKVPDAQPPQSQLDFLQQIEDGKANIWTQVQKLNTATGKTGVAVDLKPMADSLDEVINSKSIQLENPQAIEYAKNLQTRLKTIGSLTPEEAQAAITSFNARLKNFYTNPTADEGSKAVIDAALTNNLRNGLDKQIESVTGDEAAPLRQLYGDYTQVEKQVAKAAARGANRSTKGLLDFTNIVSGGDIARGILTMNPAEVVKGGTMNLIAQWYKNLNSPDAQISGMFSRLFDYYGNATAGTVTSAIPPSVLDNLPKEANTPESSNYNLPQESPLKLSSQNNQVDAAKFVENAMKTAGLTKDQAVDLYVKMGVAKETGGDVAPVLYRGENAANKGGITFSPIKEEAAKFGKVIEGKLPVDFNVLDLTTKEGREAMTPYIQNAINTGETTLTNLYKPLWKLGVQAVKDFDPLTGKVSYIVNPKYIGQVIGK